MILVASLYVRYPNRKYYVILRQQSNVLNRECDGVCIATQENGQQSGIWDSKHLEFHQKNNTLHQAPLPTKFLADKYLEMDNQTGN